MDEVTAVTEIQRTVRVAQEQQFAEACESGDVDSVREFLEHGVSVTAEVASQGRTLALPLIVAARAGHAECVRAILDAGASVDEPCGPERETAIHVAATCGCVCRPAAPSRCAQRSVRSLGSRWMRPRLPSPTPRPM